MLEKIVFILLFLLSIQSSQSQEVKLEDDIHIIHFLKKLVISSESAKSFIDGLVEKFGISIIETQSIGFGGKKRRVFFHGKYLTYQIKILEFQSYIAEIRIRSGTYERKIWDAISDQIIEAWKENLEILEKSVEFIWITKEKFIFEEKVAAALGRKNAIKLETQYTSSYEKLMDPLAFLVYGERCYDTGSWPPGRREMENLIKSNDLNLFKNILRSCNPEGRIYAIEGLLRISKNKKTKLPKEIKANIARISNIDGSISVCEGCLVGLKISSVNAISWAKIKAIISDEERYHQIYLVFFDQTPPYLSQNNVYENKPILLLRGSVSKESDFNDLNKSIKLVNSILPLSLSVGIDSISNHSSFMRKVVFCTLLFFIGLVLIDKKLQNKALEKK